MNSTSSSTDFRPTQEQISERAKAIWQERGQPSGQDDEIWFAAERQVAEEMNHRKPAGEARPIAGASTAAPSPTPKGASGTRKRASKTR